MHDKFLRKKQLAILYEEKTEFDFTVIAQIEFKSNLMSLGPFNNSC